MVAKKRKRRKSGRSRPAVGCRYKWLRFWSHLAVKSCHLSLPLSPSGRSLVVSDSGEGSRLEVESGVVSIAIQLFTMPANDTARGKHVNGKKSWTKNRALGNPKSDETLRFAEKDLL